MSQLAVAPPATGYVRYTAKRCPNCRGSLHRVCRRPFDRFFSMIVPVRRFRCAQFTCQWSGNLRVGEQSARRQPPQTGNPLFNPAPTKLPRTFIGNMLLVMAGIVTIVLLPVADLIDRDPQAYLEPSASEVSTALRIALVSAQPQRDTDSIRTVTAKTDMAHDQAR